MRLFNSIIIVLLVCSAAMADAEVSLKEFKKLIDETFQFDSADPDISLDNQYGNITITSHNQANATVKVEIIVEASKESRAQEIFDKIDIVMDHSGNKLSVRTEINGSKGWNWTKKNEQYQINYIISLPKEGDLTIENKYGNVTCTDHGSDIALDLKYGSGSLQNVGGDVDIELGYVDNFTIGSISGDADIEIAYSSLNMESAHDIDIESKYSNFSLEEAGDIQSESKYDTYDFGSIRSISNEGKYDSFKIIEVAGVTIETKYTNMKIGTLMGNGEFDFEYGGLEVKDVSSDVESITVQGKHTGIDLGMSGAYSLDVEGKYTGVDYPRNLKVENREKGDNEIMVQGYHINDNGTKITARLRYGHLHL